MLYTPVYDIGRSHAYCGPTAISAVTGEPMSVIHDVIRQASGKIGSACPVRGVAAYELISAMGVLGWDVIEGWGELVGERYTLDAFAKDHGDDGPFIVAVTGHYVAISQGEFCDTETVVPKDLFGGVLEGLGV